MSTNRKHLAELTGAGMSLVLSFAATSARADFQEFPSGGRAISIGAGHYDIYGIPHPVIIGVDYLPYEWGGFSWVQEADVPKLVSGADMLFHEIASTNSNTSGASFAIDEFGEPWDAFIGATNPGWTLYPGCVTEVAAAGNQLWIISCSKASAYGNTIAYWTGSAWQAVPGNAVKIAVSPEGTPWVLDAFGNVYKWSRSSSQFVPLPVAGCATSIGVGPNGDAWVIGCGSNGSAGNGIYHLIGSMAGSAWTEVPGSATSISVALDGTPYVINAQNRIYAWVYPTPSGGSGGVGEGAGSGSPCPGGVNCACSTEGAACSLPNTVCEPATLSAGTPYVCGACGGFAQECCSGNACSDGYQCTITDEMLTTECL